MEKIYEVQPGRRRFEGKVAIVTASTQGIGIAIAERLGIEGAAVVVSSRKQGNVEDATRKLTAKGIEALGVVCHVSNATQRKDLIHNAAQVYLNPENWKIDIIVSNAGVNPQPGEKILSTQESAIDKLWEVNVKASILLIKDAAPYLNIGSSVVFMSSISAYYQMKPLALYGITKTALLALTKVLAAELAPKTRVNFIVPGIIPTHFGTFNLQNEELQNAAKSLILERLGTTTEIAAVAAFLASDDASYITAESIVVAGGAPSRL